MLLQLAGFWLCLAEIWRSFESENQQSNGGDEESHQRQYDCVDPAWDGQGATLIVKACQNGAYYQHRQDLPVAVKAVLDYPTNEPIKDNERGRRKTLSVHSKKGAQDHKEKVDQQIFVLSEKLHRLIEKN